MSSTSAAGSISSSKNVDVHGVQVQESWTKTNKHVNVMRKERKQKGQPRAGIKEAETRNCESCSTQKTNGREP